MKLKNYGTLALATLIGCATSRTYIGEFPAPHGGTVQYEATSDCSDGVLETRFILDIPPILFRTSGAPLEVRVSTSELGYASRFSGAPVSIQESLAVGEALLSAHTKINKRIHCNNSQFGSNRTTKNE